jgi:hypothetical protein
VVVANRQQTLEPWLKLQAPPRLRPGPPTLRGGLKDRARPAARVLDSAPPLGGVLRCALHGTHALPPAHPSPPLASGHQHLVSPFPQRGLQRPLPRPPRRAGGRCSPPALAGSASGAPRSRAAASVALLRRQGGIRPLFCGRPGGVRGGLRARSDQAVGAGLVQHGRQAGQNLPHSGALGRVHYGSEGAGGDAAFDLLLGGDGVDQKLDGDVAGGEAHGLMEWLLKGHDPGAQPPPIQSTWPAGVAGRAEQSGLPRRTTVSLQAAMMLID